MNRRIFLSLSALTVLSCSPRPFSPRPVRVVIIGDSTAHTYTADEKERGWGQYISGRFSANVEVVNLAMCGRSTKTFREEGLWEQALAEKGDWYLIQFGHNDSHDKGRSESTDAATDFRENLRKYVDEERAAGGRPVLITPVRRRTFNTDGSLSDILQPYADSMKLVAREKGIPLVDLHTSSGKLFLKLGDTGSADLSCSPADRTHFSEKGARAIADLVADELKTNVKGLGKYIVGK